MKTESIQLYDKTKVKQILDGINDEFNDVRHQTKKEMIKKAVKKLEEIDIPREMIGGLCCKYLRFAKESLIYETIGPEYKRGFEKSIEESLFEDLLERINSLGNPTDLEICETAKISIRPYDAHWNFQLDDRFNQEYPGKIPAGILFNCLYFFTKQGDLIVDPMAGSGAMGKVCEVFKRRCLMYDINPFNNEIKQHDVLKGLPEECRGAELLFWDPPYYKKLVEEYGPNSIGAMCRSDFLSVFETVAIDAAKKDIKKIALLVSNYDDNYKNNSVENVSIHDYVKAIEKNSDWYWYRDIQCPLTTEQIDPKRYESYLKNKKLFGLGRSLIIFSREEYRFN